MLLTHPHTIIVVMDSIFLSSDEIDSTGPLQDMYIDNRILLPFSVNSLMSEILVSVILTSAETGRKLI